MPPTNVSEDLRITGTTRIFGVIADPIDHVRAPMVFNPIIGTAGIDAVLVPFHITPHKLEPTVRALAAMPNLGGVCVTIPHKMAMAELCDELGMVGSMTGAVNAVRFEDGRLIGDNFDGHGFIAGLEGEGIPLDGAEVLMLGGGGAARAIAASIAGSGAKKLTIANRTREKADAIVAVLAEHFSAFQVDIIGLDTIENRVAEADIIINATSLGLAAGDIFPCALENASQDVVIADIIMVPEMTPWLKKAQERGLRIHVGKHMLDYQRDLIGRFMGIFD